LHPSGVAKSSTSFGWGKGWNVTSAGWQVTLCNERTAYYTGSVRLLYELNVKWFCMCFREMDEKTGVVSDKKVRFAFALILLQFTCHVHVA